MRVPAAILVALLSTAVVACGVDRASVPADAVDCGAEDGSYDVDGRRCLLAAFVEGTPATFTSRQMSIEGDPIVRSYVTHAGAPVRIAHDARRDRFGSGRIEHLACERLVPVEEWMEQNDGGGGSVDMVFVEDGCTES